jgi:hypothetical protein
MLFSNENYMIRDGSPNRLNLDYQQINQHILSLIFVSILSLKKLVEFSLNVFLYNNFKIY